MNEHICLFIWILQLSSWLYFQEVYYSMSNTLFYKKEMQSFFSFCKEKVSTSFIFYKKWTGINRLILINIESILCLKYFYWNLLKILIFIWINQIWKKGVPQQKSNPKIEIFLEKKNIFVNKVEIDNDPLHFQKGSLYFFYILQKRFILSNKELSYLFQEYFLLFLSVKILIFYLNYSDLTEKSPWTLKQTSR